MSAASAAGPASADKWDPQRNAVYRAESAALADGGRRFERFAELETFVRSVLADPWWEARFPEAPAELDVLRRPRTATFSAAHVDCEGTTAVVWIRDGSWDAATVVHELAHVAVGGERRGPPHGAVFTAALLDLWRRYLGVHAYGALRSAFDDHGVEYQRARLGRPEPAGR